MRRSQAALAPNFGLGKAATVEIFISMSGGGLAWLPDLLTGASRIKFEAAAGLGVGTVGDNAEMAHLIAVAQQFMPWSWADAGGRDERARPRRCRC